MTANESSLVLDPLVELTAVLASSGARAGLPRALAVLAESLEARSATLTLKDESGALRPEASWGLPPDVAERVRFAPGEGVTGRVVSTGKPVVVPRITEEPMFLDRSKVRREVRRGGRELSFLCVPIPVDGRTGGALAVLVPYAADRAYDRDLKLLQVAAFVIGQSVAAARLTASDRQNLLDENLKLRQELRERYGLRNVVGTSHAMQQVYERVMQAAPTSTTVLLRGESGTGKELVAHALHYNSPRADRPFVKVSVGALPETLVESELFGYEPGAFTDARQQKKGRFELADGGTLFLDEIGELSPPTQVKLLRVLQEREFERLGGVEPVRVDVRLVAATHRDLEAAIRAGTFREDLYYRLNVFEVFLPPLRERKTDILLLADHFVERFAAAHGKAVRRISTSAIDMLMAYHWPGNVRELENCVERAVLVCEGGVIHGHHLPPTLQTAEGSGTLPSTSLADALAAFEKDLLQDALKSARGNCARAARLLRTTERIFCYKARRHGLAAGRFRGEAGAPRPPRS